MMRAGEGTSPQELLPGEGCRKQQQHPAPQRCWQRAGAFPALPGSPRLCSQPDTFTAASRASLPSAGHFPGERRSAKRYLKKSYACPYLRKREGVCAGPVPGLRASLASTPSPAGVRTLLLRASLRLNTSRKCSASSG